MNMKTRRAVGREWRMSAARIRSGCAASAGSGCLRRVENASRVESRAAVVVVVVVADRAQRFLVGITGNVDDEDDAKTPHINHVRLVAENTNRNNNNNNNIFQHLLVLLGESGRPFRLPSHNRTLALP